MRTFIASFVLLAGSAAPWLHCGSLRSRDRVGAEVPCTARSRARPRHYAAPLRPAAPRGVAVRQGQCRVAAGATEVLRPGREDRDVRYAVPHAEGAHTGVAGPDQVCREAGRADACN